MVCNFRSHYCHAEYFINADDFNFPHKSPHSNPTPAHCVETRMKPWCAGLKSESGTGIVFKVPSPATLV